MKSDFVDVWHGSLLHPDQNIDSLLRQLSIQERLKANAFKLADMRNRYIAVRASLRQTLAAYLDTDPQQLQFNQSEHGKPFLACESIHFNLSHTANYLVIAVANFPHIGIDIEVSRSRNNLDSLAARCFAPSELQAWRQLPDAARQPAFYRLWTKKEAFVKAVGRGLAMGLAQCEVDWVADGQLLSIPSEYGLATDWRVIELSIATAAHSALVTPKCRFDLRFRSLNGHANF